MARASRLIGSREGETVAKKTAAPLHVVKERESEPPTGDPDLTREAMALWKEGQRRCRARGRHNWGPHAVYEHRNHYEVVERCGHCRNRRTADFAKTTYGLRKVTDWKAVYLDGYLLPRGAMRVVEDIQDELVAADILSRRIIEVPDEDDD